MELNKRCNLQRGNGVRVATGKFDVLTVDPSLHSSIVPEINVFIRTVEAIVNILVGQYRRTSPENLSGDFDCLGARQNVCVRKRTETNGVLARTVRKAGKNLE